MKGKNLLLSVITNAAEYLHGFKGSAHVFASARTAASVTPHDSNANEYNCLWIGDAGDGTLKVTTAGGSVVSFAGVPVGFFPVATSVVWSTGTGVGSIVGLNW